MYLDISSMKEINSLGNLQPNLFSKFTQSRSEGSFKFSFSLSKILLNTFSISSLFISYSSLYKLMFSYNFFVFLHFSHTFIKCSLVLPLTNNKNYLLFLFLSMGKQS